MAIKPKTMLLCWALCTMTAPVRSFDPDLWKNFIPEALKNPLSRFAQDVDLAFDDLIAPLQPQFNYLKKELNKIPLIRAGLATFDKEFPLFHGLLCVTKNNNFTKFLHFSPDHPNEPCHLVPNNMELLEKAKYNASLPTKMIVHGFMDYIGTSDWMTDMKNALLFNGYYNVIVVDWSCGGAIPYSRAIKNTRVAAGATADLLMFLHDAAGVRMKDVHLIGYSLSGHVMAFVGKKIPHLGRISAMDPVGPWYFEGTDEPQLQPTDADFVDVTHTDGEFDLVKGLGFPKHAGHVDFYMNGGKDQPACHSFTTKRMVDMGLMKSLWYVPTCDHYSSVMYYMESIYAATEPDSCRFVGVKCKDYKTFESGGCGGCDEEGNCAFMGYEADKYRLKNGTKGSNKFFLRTASASPFCTYQYQVVIELGSGKNKQITSNLRLEFLSRTGMKSKLTLEKGNGTSADSERLGYLAISKYPLRDIQQASMWWGLARKPTREAKKESSHDFGVTVKSVRITPLTVSSAKEGSAKTIVLCGDGSKLLSTRQYLTVSRSECSQV